MALDRAIWVARLLFKRGPLMGDVIREEWRKEDEYGQAMAYSTFFEVLNRARYRFHLYISRSATGAYQLDAEDHSDADFIALLVKNQRRGVKPRKKRDSDSVDSGK